MSPLLRKPKASIPKWDLNKLSWPAAPHPHIWHWRAVYSAANWPKSVWPFRKCPVLCGKYQKLSLWWLRVGWVRHPLHHKLTTRWQNNEKDKFYPKLQCSPSACLWRKRFHSLPCSHDHPCVIGPFQSEWMPIFVVKFNDKVLFVASRSRAKGFGIWKAVIKVVGLSDS